MVYYKLNAFQRIRAHILSKTRYMLRPPLSLTCHINTPNKPPDILATTCGRRNLLNLSFYTTYAHMMLCLPLWNLLNLRTTMFKPILSLHFNEIKHTQIQKCFEKNFNLKKCFKGVFYGGRRWARTKHSSNSSYTV